MDKTKK